MTNLQLPPDLAARFCELGYHPGQYRLLLLAPAVQTAWAEGFMQAAEQRTIEKFARETVRVTAAEVDELNVWFEHRPSDDQFGKLTGILNEWLDRMPVPDGGALKNSIVSVCLEVAQSSPRIGFTQDSSSPVCPDEERELLDIRQRLGIAT